MQLSNVVKLKAGIPISPTQINSPIENDVTSKAEVLMLMGELHYDGSRTPCQNLIRFLLNKGKLLIPDTEIFTINGWDVSFDGEKSDHLIFLANLKFGQNCRLISKGRIEFFEGTFAAANEDAIVVAKGSRAVANAVVTGSEAIADASGATANAYASFSVSNANAFGSKAYAWGYNSTACALVNGASSYAMVNFSKATAEADGTNAYAEGIGSSASAIADGSKAHANATDSQACTLCAAEAEAYANADGSKAYARAIKSTAFSTAIGAWAYAHANYASARATVEGALVEAWSFGVAYPFNYQSAVGNTSKVQASGQVAEYCEVLGIEQGSLNTLTKQEIKKAYYAKSKRLHPDKNPYMKNETKEQYEARINLPFKKLGEAFEGLNTLLTK